MNAIQIGRKRLSEIVWGIIIEKTHDFSADRVYDMVQGQQLLRAKADYNTGCVPYEDALDLCKIVFFFRPKVIAEVGTFIGVSTRVMHWAMPNDGQIYTCDMSNDIDLGLNQVTQYPKKPSHEMFADLESKGVKVDMVYLDGRLSEKDIAPLMSIIHDKTIFVLDDFEGTEKGVANALILEGGNIALVYPREGNKTAIVIPMNMLQLIHQEDA